jgi:ATP/maltotriose-dependent transcriptional regulator MalT
LDEPLATSLLHHAAQSHTLSAPIRTLLADLLDQFPEIPSTLSPSFTLFEDLSSRELDILPFLAAGLSNKAIADELYLSAGTVKWHLKSIYRKLDVHSRTQAVATARDLNLIR